ncbi:orotidine-5'-phosphate decarboxylase [Pyruvatibacter mobilis]|uniref:orotidine-5'-phosphate decarboxylase n=1 Tax=Pyruvatibacter mobilis TaxID=1712261 RepID=UPI003C7C340B
MTDARTISRNPVFCALDTPSPDKAARMARQVGDAVGGLKLGLEFFMAAGPEGFRTVAKEGRPLFLDLKLHDIPNTVAGAVRSLLPLKPAILNVHAQGGMAMMQAARDAANEAPEGERPLMIAVTMLTSLDQADLERQGNRVAPADYVRRLAEQAAEAGLDGVVCSAHEIETLRMELGPDFKLIVPGIRPAGADIGDQKRVMTPAEARALGADILVIGRPITAADDPAAAARAIADDLGC